MRALPLAAFLLALPAHAATLRGGTTLSGPAVRLSDLWDGVENDRAIGPGPELGGRIVVEAPQLGAIARSSAWTGAHPAAASGSCWTAPAVPCRGTR